MIALLQTMLSFSKKHAQPIIVALLGIIVASGIAGGLHIKTLSKVIDEKNSTIAQLQQVEAQRQEASESATAARVASLERQIGDLRKRVGDIDAYTSYLSAAVNRHLAGDTAVADRIAELPPLPSRSNLAGAPDTPAALAAQIRAAAAGTKEDIERAKLFIGLASKTVGSHEPMHMELVESPRRPSTSFFFRNWLLLALAGIGVLLATWGLLGRRSG